MIFHIRDTDLTIRMSYKDPHCAYKSNNDRENGTYLDAMDLYRGNVNGVAAWVIGGTNDSNDRNAKNTKKIKRERRRGYNS